MSFKSTRKWPIGVTQAASAPQKNAGDKLNRQDNRHSQRWYDSHARNTDYPNSPQGLSWLEKALANNGSRGLNFSDVSKNNVVIGFLNMLLNSLAQGPWDPHRILNEKLDDQGNCSLFSTESQVSREVFTFEWSFLCLGGCYQQLSCFGLTYGNPCMLR